MRSFVMRSSSDMDKEMDRIEEHQKAYIQFLSDMLHDRKRDSNFLKGVIVGLIVLIIFLVAGMVLLVMNNQNKLIEQADRSEKRMYEFISEYDFSSSIDIDTGTITDSDNSGYVNFTGK